jgi:hypothetical protein
MQPSLYRLRILTIIVAILILPFALYYLIIVRSQSAYFTERSFRKLSLISNQISSKVESAGLVLRNNSEKFINPEQQTNTKQYDPEPNQREKNVENLRNIFSALKDDSPQITIIDAAAATGDDLQLPGTIILTNVRQEADGPVLYLTYISESKSNSRNGIVKVQAKADLQGLLQPLLSTRAHIAGAERDQFQDILISETGTGKVIFQNDTTQVRLASLDKLTAADDTAKKIELKDVPQTSNLMDVALAGTKYKLFSQPVEISLHSANGKTTNPSWIVSGLTRSDYFQSEVWSISYTVLIFCAFVTALLILSWPFLKLVLIGPKDRLGSADIYFLTFSILIILALFTAIGLYGYSYWTLEAGMDSQLSELSLAVEKNFKTELTDALNQLDTLSKNSALLARLNSASDSTNQTKPQDIYQSAETDKANILPDILRSPATTYPYFDTAVWIDENGKQQAKWTIKNENTQYINVTSRGYFSNLRRGDHYEFNNHEFWLEPIISRTTGRNEVEISKFAADPKWITAFDTRLISLMQPVMPAGFGYVIIADDGKVLFHSDEAHHLGENFFQECDEDSELRSAVVGRTNVPLNIRYVGEGYRALVKPFDNFPHWSLVVFQNKQPLRSAFLELLTLVSLLFLLYTLIILFCFIWFYLVNRKNERREWIWPTPRKRGVYYQSFLLLFALSLASGLLTFYLEGRWLLGVIAGFGLLSGLLFFLSIRFGKSVWPRRLSVYLGARWLGRYDVAYVLDLAFLLLLMAILPAAAFFRYAYQSEMKAFIKHGQFTFAEELAKRDQRIRSQYANMKIPAEEKAETDPTAKDDAKKDRDNLTAFIEKRSAGIDWDVYDEFFFGTEWTKADGSRCSGEDSSDLVLPLNKLIPLFNQTSIERRGLLATAIANGFCKWEPAPNHHLVLHLDKQTIGETAWPKRHMSTLVPPMGIPGPFWLGLFALAFLPFFTCVRFVVRKVFLLDVYKPSSRPLQSFLSEKIDRNLFIVVDAPFAEKKPTSDSNICLNDVRKLIGSPGWEANLTKIVPESKVFGLDHFGYEIDDPQSNQQKLSAIETLLQRKRTLVIFSDAEPSRYLFTNGGNGNGDLDNAGRWARVMSQFFTEYAEDTGDRYAFAERVKEERKRILKMDLRGRSEKEINDLIDTLAAECAPKGPLQQIGLQILAHNSFITLNREHLLNRIVSQARPYYNHLWNSCSTAEKMTLFHLAQDRLLSHRDPDIERLLRTELIVRDNDVHLLNDSFRQFVKSTENFEFVAKQEAETKKASLWHTLKVPILVVLVAVSIFLFVTQKDLYTSALAIVTAVTTIIPAFFKVLTIFHSDPFGGSPSQS